MEKETIDVLVPVYNSAPYLEKCLTSILTQTYKNIRVVIVDDASTDGSGEIIKKLQDKFSNIEYYVRVGDKGISKARNFLLEKITSKYFTFFDSDDYAEPTYLETMYNLMKAYNVDMALCGRIRHSEFKDVNAEKYNKNPSVILMNQEEVIAEMFSYRLFDGTVYCKLFKTSLLGNAKFDEKYFYGEDLDFCFKVMQNCKTFALSTEKLYHYLVRKGSIVTSKFSEKKLTLIDCYNNIVEKVKDNPTLEICVRSMQGLIAVELLYYTFRDKYKDKTVKTQLKTLIKQSLPYIKQNKRLSRLHRSVRYVWWLSKIM